MTMDINLGCLISGQISLIAQHDTSRLDFPTLITSLCKARGVTSNSLTFESLSPAINLAYIKKNCWNLNDPSVTFRGTQKSRARRSEVPPSSALAPAYASTSAPSASTPIYFYSSSSSNSYTFSRSEFRGFLVYTTEPALRSAPDHAELAECGPPAAGYDR